MSFVMPAIIGGIWTMALCTIVGSVHPAVSEPWSTAGSMCLLLYLASMSLMAYSYALAWLTDPGTVPREWDAGGMYIPPAAVPQDVAVAISESWRFCHPCGQRKPPRSHHCRDCGRCVLAMDHHCPWISNCCGHRNYKYFILFLVYTATSCLFNLAYIARWLQLFLDEAGAESPRGRLGAPRSHRRGRLRGVFSSSSTSTSSASKSTTKSKSAPASASTSKSASTSTSVSTSSLSLPAATATPASAVIAAAAAAVASSVSAAGSAATAAIGTSAGPGEALRASASAAAAAATATVPSVTDGFTGYTAVMIVLTALAAFSFGVGVFFLFSWHAWLILCRKSTLEYYRAPTPSDQDWRSPSTGRWYSISYDLGTWRNVCEAMGPWPLMWLLPTVSHLGDGINWPVVVTELEGDGSLGPSRPVGFSRMYDESSDSGAEIDDFGLAALEAGTAKSRRDWQNAFAI
jgi:hypothetical protein